VAEDDTNFGSRKGEDSNRESYHKVGKLVYLQDGCHGGTSLGAPKKGCYADRARFPRGAWTRISTRSHKALVRKLHPDIRIARGMQEDYTRIARS
jgi:hypothetical protein